MFAVHPAYSTHYLIFLLYLLPRPYNTNVLPVLAVLREEGIPLRNAIVVVDCDGISLKIMVNRSPCLTKSRAKNGFWLVWKGRRMTINEMFRLQGMKPARMRPAIRGVAKSHVGEMIGNAFTESVIGRVLVQLLPCAGLSDALVDPWV